jgi:hypothetical protein
MANSLKGNNNTNSFVGNLSNVKTSSTIAEIDRVNIFEFENGMDVELTELGGELTSDNIRKAQSKVLKNLKKDPAYYTNKIAEETIKTFGEYGSGKKSGKYSTNKDAEAVKAEVKTPKDETPSKDKANELKSVGKIEKSNVSKDKKPTMAKKPKEMTQTPKKAKGIKKIMEMPGKEKKINLKENKESQDVSPEQRKKLEQVISSWRQSGKKDMADALERLLNSKSTELKEIDLDDRDSVKKSFQKQVKPKEKSIWDIPHDEVMKYRAAGDKKPKNSSKIKLTKEVVDMIQGMVSEAVRTYTVKGRTGAEKVVTLSDQDKQKLQQSGNTLTDF